MSNYVTLLGADDVSRAGSQMRSAADEMQRAASQIEAALDRHERFLEEWICRFEAAVEKANGKTEGG